MQKILAIGWTDLRIFLSSRENLVGLLLIPTVLTVVLGFVGGGSAPSIDIALIDEDQSAPSDQLIERVAEVNARFAVYQLDETDEASARQRVADGEFDALLVIPSGFSEALSDYTPLNLTYYSNEDPTSPSIIEPGLQAVIGQFNTRLIAERVGTSVAETVGATVDPQAIGETASDILAQEPISINFQMTETDSTNGTGFEQSVPGMGTMFVMFTILGGMAVLVRERQQWTLQRLVMMPVSRAQIIGGKIVAYFTLGMIQYAVVFAIGYVFGMNFGSSVLGLLLIASAFSLTATALTFTVAVFMRTEGQAGQLTTLLALSLAALGGAWWPLDIVPDFMRVIGHISPIAWAMDGFQKLIWYDQGTLSVLPEVGILLAIAGALFAVGIVGFRYE
ncbi:MAG: ABC transporter permease [Anaerolineae bacterium]